MTLPREQVARRLESARAARGQGKLIEARTNLDAAYEGLDARDRRAAQALAEEGARLGAALEGANAPLAALSELLRAWEAAKVPQVGEGITRLVQRYAEWRPQPIEVAPGTAIRAAATGAFWVGIGTKGRVVALEGGIPTESVQAARRALDRASVGVSWLLLDLRGLGYIGSSGLATIVKVAELLGNAGGGLVLFDVVSAQAVLIDTLGLARFFTPAASIQAALGKVQERRAAAASAAAGSEPPGGVSAPAR